MAGDGFVPLAGLGVGVGLQDELRNRVFPNSSVVERRCPDAP